MALLCEICLLLELRMLNDAMIRIRTITLLLEQDCKKSTGVGMHVNLNHYYAV
jgi:hypothetical protein